MKQLFEIEIAVQICGKVKGKLVVPADSEEDAVWALINADPSLSALLNGKQIIKKIYVKGRLFNIVAK